MKLFVLLSLAISLFVQNSLAQESSNICDGSNYARTSGDFNYLTSLYNTGVEFSDQNEARLYEVYNRVNGFTIDTYYDVPNGGATPEEVAEYLVAFYDALALCGNQMSSPGGGFGGPSGLNLGDIQPWIITAQTGHVDVGPMEEYPGPQGE